VPDLPKEVPDLKLEVPDRRSGGMRPNLSTGSRTAKEQSRTEQLRHSAYVDIANAMHHKGPLRERDP